MVKETTISVNEAVSQLKEKLKDNLPTISILSQYRAFPEWFHPDQDGVHDLPHAARVLIFQELLAKILISEGIQLDVEALRWGASTHDVGQDATDDYEDDTYGLEHHGIKSARWIDQNLHSQIKPDSFEVLKYIVTWHFPEDEEAPEMIPELAVLKDADALDRERVNWAYTDPEFLRFDVSRKLLIPIARQLINMTRNINPSQDQFDAVLEAGVTLGIIKNE